MAAKEKMLLGRRKLDDTTTSMSQVKLNDLVVSFRPLVKKARVAVVHKLARQILTLKKKKGNEKQVAKNNKKAGSFKDEIEALKTLSLDIVIKHALANTTSMADLGSKTHAEDRVILRIACHKFLTKKIEKWRSEHDDWKELAAFMLYKNTSRRYKKIKKVHFENIPEAPQKPETVKIKLSSKKTESNGASEKNVADKKSAKQSPKSSKIKGKDRMELDRTESDSNSSDSEKEITSINSVKAPKKSVQLKKQQQRQEISEDSSSEDEDDDFEDECLDQKIVSKSQQKNVQSNKVGIQKISEDEDGVSSSVDSASSSDESTQEDIHSKGLEESSAEMVVKKLDLSSFADAEEVTVDDQDAEFLFKDTSSKPEPKKKRDSFFWGGSSSEDDDDVSDGDSGRETDQEVADDVQDEIPAAMSRDSVFVGSLSSKKSQRGNRSKQQEGAKRTGKSNKGASKPFGSNKSSLKGDNRREEKQTTSTKPNKLTSRAAPVKAAKPDVTKRAAPESDTNLHPSWAASKKRKEQSSIQSFTGKKTTFSDDDD